MIPKTSLPSPEDLYLDNPAQAKRSSGYEKRLSLSELRRSSTHYGVGELRFACKGLSKCKSYGLGCALDIRIRYYRG